MERVKCRVFAGLAALVLAGGILVAAGPPAGAATQLCGSTCVTLITANYGSSEAMDVQSLQVAAGTAVDLGASGAYLGEDFHLDYVATTTQLYQDGLVPIEVAKNWPSYPVYQYIFTPDGYQGYALCLGLAVNAASGTPVTLQSCGVDDHTLWIPDKARESNGWEPMIAGSDTRATKPYVLQAHNPDGQLTIQELTTGVTPSQYWQNLTGVL